ncbi:haloalkane dehalogenase [Litorivivens lipolytica]|uniref:Haloalkane dehalogenase n=1 Tax=Litorivivens lipolytica TaxID=1524264 RepID=A0A7W4Z591_9GAMM|nr:haloalkane dehalogenase [Litorivivens lipolytica]MBB3047254.1 haloalkane dehalogenase [Litorivivens lipolytica]
MILRTPEQRFAALPDFPYSPHYLTLPHAEGELRMAYIDEGPRDAPVVLMLHGEPSWSFAYRHVIAAVAAAGYRAVAPDHIGFGRSDKLPHRSDYSYAAFVAWMTAFVDQLDLKNIVLVCQDWGGPIGLSTLAARHERFSGVVAANTLLPNCELPPAGIADWPGEIVTAWVGMTAEADDLPVADIVDSVSVKTLAAEVKAAYDAPFPDASYKAAVLEFPSLIPTRENMAGCAENRQVWQLLETWDKPFVTAFSDSDPSTAPWAEVFRKRIPGADNDLHTTLRGAGHFVQEELGAELAEIVLKLRAIC